MQDFNLGEGIDLEQDLDAEHMASLCRLGTRQTFRRHAYLYHQGDEATHVFILNSGTVKATCTDENGHEALLKIHGPGSMLGLSALRPRAIRDANGVALETVVVTCFGRDEFFDYMRADGELGLLLVRVLLKRQQQLHARVSDMTGHSVAQRLARVLIQLNAEIATRIVPGDRTVIHITHEELATLVLSRRQYVTEILRSFVARGFIESGRNAIAIIDLKGLAEIAGGERVSAA